MTSVQSTNQHNGNLNDQYEREILVLEGKIDHYRQTLEIIESAAELATDQQISDVFAACKQSHDGLEALISQINAAKKAEQLNSSVRQTVRSLNQTIDALDARLRKKSEFIQKSIELFNWQKTYLLPDKSSLRLIDPPVARDRFDWFWRLLSLLFFGISFTLLTDVIKRSLTGGIDAGSVGTIVGSALLSLGSGGILVQFKEENLRQIFSSLGIHEQWQGRVLAGASFGCLALLFFMWLSLPGLGSVYVGLAQQADNLAKREDYYTRAIALDPGNIQAHLRLANLYYEQQDYDKALVKYKAVWNNSKLGGSTVDTSAASGRSLAKYMLLWNNGKNQDEEDRDRKQEEEKEAISAMEQIIQIYISKDDISRANSSLKRLIGSIDTVKPPVSLTDKQLSLIQILGRIHLISEKNKNYGEANSLFDAGYRRTTDREWLYTMLVHKGWVQMRQELLNGAEVTLRSAIGIDGKENQASAHCLLAQVLQLQVNKQQVLSAQLTSVEIDQLKQADNEWRTCFAQKSTEDEVNWGSQAKKALNEIEDRLKASTKSN